MINSETSETSQENKKNNTDKKKSPFSCSQILEKTKSLGPIIKTKEEWDVVREQVKTKVGEDLASFRILGVAPIFNIFGKSDREGLFSYYAADGSGKIEDKDELKAIESLSKRNRRNKYTRIDKSFQRIFPLKDGRVVVVDGPILCQNDATILSVLIRLYLQKGYGAGLVDFSYNEIVLDLGFSHTSEDQISDIKESIARLRLTRIYIYRGAELDVCREPIADFKPLANRGRSSRGQVCLNGWFVDQFVKNNFSVQSIEKLRDMNQTEKFLYRKISESDAADLIIPLPEFWKSGKSWRDGFVWDELKESQQNSTLRELRRALIGLKKLGLIKNESGVKRGTINLMPT